jgi:hypothetical protein
MNTISIARCPINEMALHQELKAELGEDYLGLSTTPEAIVLHFEAEAASEDISLARIIVKSHDPLKLTAAQQAEKQRMEALEEANTQYPNALDSRLYANESALIVELAERLRRLELMLGGYHAG